VNKVFLKIVVLLLLGIGSVLISTYRDSVSSNDPRAGRCNDLTDLANLKRAFENQQSNIQVKQVGRIAKILRDDNHSPRHQRFIVEFGSGHKILIAHNIDLAAKVEGLKEGEEICFYGEYEWNNRGGVVHWTHRDPKGLHPDGWLLYAGNKYD
jgi:hypothetical protein